MPRKRKGAGDEPAPRRMMAVRLLYGERAGQIVRVTAEEAAELFTSWPQRAEPVAVKPHETAERR